MKTVNFSWYNSPTFMAFGKICQMVPCELPPSLWKRGTCKSWSSRFVLPTLSPIAGVAGSKRWRSTNSSTCSFISLPVRHIFTGCCCSRRRCCVTVVLTRCLMTWQVCEWLIWSVWGNGLSNTAAAELQQWNLLWISLSTRSLTLTGLLRADCSRDTVRGC